MSKPNEQTANEKQGGRVQMGILSEQENELTRREAENVKGGGGARGGVVVRSETQRMPIGEEIPQ